MELTKAYRAWLIDWFCYVFAHQDLFASPVTFVCCHSRVACKANLTHRSGTLCFLHFFSKPFPLRHTAGSLYLQVWLISNWRERYWIQGLDAKCSVSQPWCRGVLATLYIEVLMFIAGALVDIRQHKLARTYVRISTWHNYSGQTACMFANSYVRTYIHRYAM